MADPAPVPQDDTGRRIVLVMGPGRSGTSTIAGALVHCGLQVPGKAISANETNPSGFFEPRWVVDLHKRLLDRARVNTLDTDPQALAVVAKAVGRAGVRDELRQWLGNRLEEHPQLVVKDPRGIWFRDLWVDAADDLGVEPGFLTMLRHPAEVSASRERYYAAKKPGETPDDVTRIAGWVNVALTAERTSRGSRRVFVRYADLVADWRTQLDRVAATLDLRLDPPPSVSPHPVDDFIDPSLHRVQVDWDDLSIPVALRDLGERTWTVMNGLADVGGERADDAELIAEADRLREEYAAMSRAALALNRHAIRRLEVQARQRGVRAGRNAAARGGAGAPQPSPKPSGLLGRLRGRG